MKKLTLKVYNAVKNHKWKYLAGLGVVSGLVYWFGPEQVQEFVNVVISSITG